MLHLFDRCYRKGDPKMMHVRERSTSNMVVILTILQHCAQTLLDFNGGASCVQVYVNQHDFFINRVPEETEQEDKTLCVSDVIFRAYPPSRLMVTGGTRYQIQTRYHQRTSPV